MSLLALVNTHDECLSASGAYVVAVVIEPLWAQMELLPIWRTYPGLCRGLMEGKGGNAANGVDGSGPEHCGRSGGRSTARHADYPGV